MGREDLDRVEVESRAQLRAWFEAHHRQRESIWLVTFKRHVAGAHVPYEDVCEECLCFGWVDSQVKRVDGDRSRQLLSPRRPGSTWAASNKRRLARLESSGRMAAAGRAAVEAAKADGSWTLLDDVEALVVPADLRAALESTPDAAGGWERLRPSAKKAALWWVKSAKRGATRASRIAKTSAAAARGEAPVG